VCPRNNPRNFPRLPDAAKHAADRRPRHLKPLGNHRLLRPSHLDRPLGRHQQQNQDHETPSLRIPRPRIPPTQNPRTPSNQVRFSRMNRNHWHSSHPKKDFASGIVSRNDLRVRNPAGKSPLCRKSPRNRSRAAGINLHKWWFASAFAANQGHSAKISPCSRGNAPKYRGEQGAFRQEAPGRMIHVTPLAVETRLACYHTRTTDNRA
jgi:hypothetical protein